ncbi:sulfotransferase 1E1-like [Littorina saxatilis]|uniref:Sulfotransferase domain-containing protein n=1 Tax=Littorina saxatilis TaxID=31220 RepID=A0AAN9AIY3_9CAEN
MEQNIQDDQHYDPVKKNGVIIDGMTFPPRQPCGVPWKEHIENLRSLELRRTDVFICAYPKAGTHWLWEVTHMLLTGKVEYETRTKENLMMEFITKETIDNLDSPRIMNTHVPFSMLPVKEMKEKGVKVLHVYRNPKDTVVSMYFHFRQVFPHLKDYSLLDFLRIFLQDDMVYGNYFCFIKQMEAFIQQNPDVPVFQLSYEAMRKENQVQHVQRLAKFLEVEASEDLCERITEACSFQKMKQADQSKTLPSEISSHTMTKDTKMYRKGEVGDWKNYLTVAMNEMMDGAIQEKLPGSSYTLQYT